MDVSVSPTPHAAAESDVQRAALAFTGASVRAWDALAGVSRLLVRELDWEVQRGEHWAILGANGAGKTTMLNLAAGIVEPSAGTVTVLGEDLHAPGLCDPRLRIGMVDATPGVFAQRMSATQVVLTRSAASAALRGKTITEDERARARELLELFGCGELRDRRYGDCSRGERQRVQLARALMRRPALLLLDEPASSLDLPGREALLHAVTRLAATHPELTTVTVTHHLEELAPSITHALLLRDGAVVAAGPADEVFTDDRLRMCFGVAVSVVRLGERWAVRTPPPAW